MISAQWPQPGQIVHRLYDDAVDLTVSAVVDAVAYQPGRYGLVNVASRTGFARPSLRSTCTSRR